MQPRTTLLLTGVTYVSGRSILHVAPWNKRNELISPCIQARKYALKNFTP